MTEPAKPTVVVVGPTADYTQAELEAILAHLPPEAFFLMARYKSDQGAISFWRPEWVMRCAADPAAEMNTVQGVLEALQRFRATVEAMRSQSETAGGAN